MRVLLIYSNQSREVEPAAPIGLSYVAAATRAAGHVVQLLDLAFSADIHTALRNSIATFRPEAVGLSIRNIDNVISQRFESPLAALQAQAAVIRDACGPDVPLILGGPSISILGAQALPLFQADFAIVGEGEAAFPALLTALHQHASVQQIAGVCYWRDGRPQRNPPALLPGFAGSGMEDFVCWRDYQQLGGTWPLQSKRGCPMRCSYCTYPLIEGRKQRLRDPLEVLDEVERVWRETGARCFEFVDSTFNTPSTHAIAVCEEIVRRREAGRLKTSFTTMGINPRDVPIELFPLMRRAGFNSMMVSPEAGCDAMLKSLRKGFTMREVARCADLARHAGLKSLWCFMLGAPGETTSTCDETLNFAETRLAGGSFLSVFFTGIRILPGTALAAQALAEGYIQPDTDLAGGVFYRSPLVPEEALIKRVTQGILRNPCIVHAADSQISDGKRRVYRWLDRFGVPGPYWRFLPGWLNLAPIRYLRGRSLAPDNPSFALTT
ncbi:B12-binding domain-containing radical SAM protein [Viridibacterium curvum]|uniref:B12-binding domain-containing radical SAM protein n=1 Tax=Viridibacterium curvum TaxID=1101404 RepID=A0ABP9QDA6_9RHOO